MYNTIVRRMAMAKRTRYERGDNLQFSGDSCCGECFPWECHTNPCGYSNGICYLYTGQSVGFCSECDTPPPGPPPGMSRQMRRFKPTGPPVYRKGGKPARRKPTRKFQTGGHSHHHTHPRGGHQHWDKSGVRPTRPQGAGEGLNCHCACAPDNNQIEIDEPMWWGNYLSAMSTMNPSLIWCNLPGLPIQGVCMNEHDGNGGCFQACSNHCSQVNFSSADTYSNWPAGWFTNVGAACSFSTSPVVPDSSGQNVCGSFISRDRRNVMRRGGKPKRGIR